MSTRTFILAAPLALALAGPAAAQETRAYITPRAQGGGFSIATSREDGDRAVIGITTGSGSARDTLGILVSTITAGGPAEKAGLEEGMRISAINGVNLKLAAADVGDWEMSSALTRRFTREMARIKAGDEVELKLVSGGTTKTVKVKTVMYDDLYNASRMVTRRRDDDDRAVLGVSLGSSGSKRDTLGVLISMLDDAGPAAKAGLEEGNRIQAINGIDLKVTRDDAGDSYISSSKVRRLQREIEKLKVGDEVTLKVYVGGGRTRDVKIKTVAASDLPNRGFSIFSREGVSGQGGFMVPTPARPPLDMEIRRRMEELPQLRELEGRLRSLDQIAPTIQRALSSRIIL
jgi:serine protease Do